MRRPSLDFLVLFLVSLFVAESAFSINAKVLRQDVKPATQKMLEYQSVDGPEAADTDQVLETHAGPTSAAVTAVTTFTAQPDFPRNLTITPTGTTTDVETCTVTVAGTNIFGRAITEDFAFAANASTATVGAKAFKTVTSASWSADCESGSFGATWIIGVGDKLGLHRCMAKAGHLVFSTVDGAYETTRPTVTADADEVEKNTIDTNTAYDDTKVVENFFIQNWACLP
jgi:hypothetical protein